jgi:hypothetical protein
MKLWTFRCAFSSSTNSIVLVYYVYSEQTMRLVYLSVSMVFDQQEVFYPRRLECLITLLRK